MVFGKGLIRCNGSCLLSASLFSPSSSTFFPYIGKQEQLTKSLPHFTVGKAIAIPEIGESTA